MKPLLFFFLFLSFPGAFAQSDKFSTYYNQRRTLFEMLPDTKHEVIFLGNSITDGGEWAELFSNAHVKNRGISGDTTEGVLYRLNEVTRSKPDKIFLLIGINDLAGGIPKDSVFKNICKIARSVRELSPKTKLYIQSILPVNSSYQKFPNHTNKTEPVLWINDQLKNWCSANNFGYINLYDRFVLPDSHMLNPEYTNDGLHLVGCGYLVWAQIIRPYLK
jgi:lysophospholipase L1-like esterase